ncbi:MAG: hypothetical protein IKM44_01315, partial [Clostridia bacterium]|nr:hypothetical protein [Clostridia bacterium]
MTEKYTYNGNAELTEKVLGCAVNHTYKYSYKDNVARDLDYVGFGNYKFYPLSDVNGRNTGREIYNGENRIAAEY